MTDDRAAAQRGLLSGATADGVVAVWCKLAFAAVIIGAASVRLFAASSDLWLDEIWSLSIALRLEHPFDALGIRHDNNHILNTAWLAWLGFGHSELLYRLPSVLGGIVTVVVAGALARGTGKLAALATMWLFATSVLLVTHASEARGYALSICFSLSSLLVLERRLAGSRCVWLVPLFWALTLLALLSHLSAVMAYGAIALYWLARALRDGDRRTVAREAAFVHGVPVAALFALYFFFVRLMKVGGGYEMSAPEVVARAAALTLGASEDFASLGFSALIVVGLSGFALFELMRARDLRWVLFSAALLLPVLVIVATDVRHAGPRYLLVSVSFFLLLLGSASGRFIARGGVARVACVSLLCCLLALNAMGDVELLRLGRGSYRRALAFMLEHSAQGRVTVMSDHDFRNRVLLDYYARIHPEGARIAYLSASEVPKEGAQWLILHRVAGAPGIPADHVVVRNLRYDKRLSLPCAVTSGMSWYLYHQREPEPPY